MSDVIQRREVLDRGYVELVDFMGDENAVVDAARVSFGKRSTEYTDEQNDKLLQYLKDHNHSTPWEMICFKFRVKAPVIVWWQWTRHRMASYNFQSGRYIPFEETEVYRVGDDQWRKQSSSNKQGSDGFLHSATGCGINSRVDALYEQAFELYDDMLKAGVAREQARLVLPFAAVYYSAIVQMNARSLQNFLHLRTAGDAQSEIRDYAKAIQSIVQETHPRLFP